MTKVFVVEIKMTGVKYAYTSLTALTILHKQKDLGISKSTLDRFDFDIANYENDKIIIEKLNALSTVEARKLKESVI